ncbi:MAG: M48 family metalloprotease [Planctomycetes bacterium]|nr:M48 family metalloprotease [Planctomycetota bacterium]
MNPAPFLIAHGGSLALGTTLVLAIGLLAMACTRQVILRRRLGGLLTFAVVAYLLAAWLPWPSWRAALAPASAPATVRAAAARPVPAPPWTESAAASLLPPERRAAAWLQQLETELAELQPAAASPSSPPRSSPWPAWLAWAWLAGSALVSLRLLHGVWSLRRLLRSSVPAPSPLTTGLMVPASARIRVVAAPVRPFCVGLWRPTVVLPQELCAPERRHQAIAVLRHELAHLQNGDAALQVMLATLSVLLFWHPLFLLLRQQVRFTSELLADDAAARGHGVQAYAHELIELASREHPLVPALGAVSVFHRPSEFYRRIQMLLQREGSLSVSVPFHRRLAHGLGAAALVAAVGALLPASGRAQDPEPSAATQAESLRATIAALQLEIARMRALVESLQQGATDARIDVPVVAEAPTPESGWTDLRPPSVGTSPIYVYGRNHLIATPYRIKQGDSIERILRVHGIADADGTARMLQLNPGLDLSRLKVGQSVLVPVANPPALPTPAYVTVPRADVPATPSEPAEAATPVVPPAPATRTGDAHGPVVGAALHDGRLDAVRVCPSRHRAGGASAGRASGRLRRVVPAGRCDAIACGIRGSGAGRQCDCRTDVAVSRPASRSRVAGDRIPGTRHSCRSRSRQHPASPCGAGEAAGREQEAADRREADPWRDRGHARRDRDARTGRR